MGLTAALALADAGVKVQVLEAASGIVEDLRRLHGKQAARAEGVS